MKRWLSVFQMSSKIFSGQLSLVICCAFYLIWWSISYQPGQEVNRVGSFRGILLGITALCGLAGIVLSIIGINDPSLKALHQEKLHGIWILVFGIITYIGLILITSVWLKRPVTTELLLITGWMVLELCVINKLNSAGMLSDKRFWVMIGILITAFIISMIMYIIYYRMEEWLAFFMAMVPLITEGISMGILLVLM